MPCRNYCNNVFFYVFCVTSITFKMWIWAVFQEGFGVSYLTNTVSTAIWMSPKTALVEWVGAMLQWRTALCPRALPAYCFCIFWLHICIVAESSVAEASFAVFWGADCSLPVLTFCWAAYLPWYGIMKKLSNKLTNYRILSRGISSHPLPTGNRYCRSSQVATGNIELAVGICDFAVINIKNW